MSDTARTTTVLPATHRFFEEALALVRSSPLQPRERPPAITLPTVAARPMDPGTGDVAGVAGDAWALAAALAGGSRSVEEVVAQARTAIERYDRAFCAFEFVADVDEVARTLDAELRQGTRRGPLHGVPITVKDVVDVAGMPTTASSRGYRRRVADADGLAVARLRAAGAIIMGKVTTHELALGVTTPQSRNPWDPDRIPGGSSGGSAISLLTGMAWASLGTDTRASIRVPAALCGLVGTMPSLDLVPRDRWVTLSWTMDHIAPMTLSVRDAALLLDVMSDRGDQFRSVLPRSLHGLRVGWSRATLAGADPGVADLTANALASIADAGGIVVEQAVPTVEDLALANAVGMLLSRVQAAQYHAEIGTDVDALTAEVRDQLRAATSVEATAYVRALRLRALLRERLEFVAGGVDVLVMPTCKTVAPRRDEASQHLLALSENCVPWSLVDFPAISLPMGMSGGLPVGLQVVAPPGQDAGLLAAAHAIERVLPPPLRWS